MPAPLVKMARFGNVVEISRFEKPLVVGGKRFNFVRRKRSKSTLKQLQNLQRVKRGIRRKVAICTQMMGSPAFVSFTYKWKDGPQLDMQKALHDWRVFARRMKRAFPTVAFLRVPERQKSGSVHFHAAVFGLPENLPCIMQKRGKFWTHSCPDSRQCERKTRVLAKIWTHGFVDAQVVRSPEAIGSYISGYLTKGDPDWSLFGNHLATTNDVMRKKIISARQAGMYWEMSTYRNSVAIGMTLEEMQGRLILRKQRMFDTRWLGRCTFEVYFVESEPPAP